MPRPPSRNAHHFATAAAVSWNWGTGQGHGKVAERFVRPVSRTLHGRRITRVGTPENPAYHLTQEDGGRVLKRGSELHSDRP